MNPALKQQILDHFWAYKGQQFKLSINDCNILAYELVDMIRGTHEADHHRELYLTRSEGFIHAEKYGTFTDYLERIEAKEISSPFAGFGDIITIPAKHNYTNCIIHLGDHILQCSVTRGITIERGVFKIHPDHRTWRV